MGTGSFLADTPGFNLPAFTSCSPEYLGRCFPEIRARQLASRCQFSDCLHGQEPNCGVSGDWERYPHYREFLALIQQQPAYLQATESTLKLQSHAGESQYEPKLALKKYRRSSRRSQHQSLQDYHHKAQ